MGRGVGPLTLLHAGGQNHHPQMAFRVDGHRHRSQQQIGVLAKLEGLAFLIEHR